VSTLSKSDIQSAPDGDSKLVATITVDMAGALLFDPRTNT